MALPISPFLSTASLPGHGIIHLSLLPPSTPSFSTIAYTYPLKLVPSTPHILSHPPSSAPPSSSSSIPSSNPLPPPIQPTSVPLLFLLTYGGGLLPPDTINITLYLDASTRLTIATQGSTKIFPSPPAMPTACATQTLTAHLGKHAALWLGPDPTQPFRGSRYRQKQVFHLDEGASLGVLDWVSEGRRARGESWAAAEWRGGNEVWRVMQREGGAETGGFWPPGTCTCLQVRSPYP